MNKLPAAVLILFLAIFGWPTGADTVSNLLAAVEVETGAAAPDGTEAPWVVARRLCDDETVREGTARFYACFEEFQALDLRALEAGLKQLTDAMARHYGLCIDRQRSQMVNCVEI